MTSFMIDILSVSSRFNVVFQQPIPPREFLFGEEPILHVVTILPAARFVDVVRESRDLRSSGAFLGVTVFGHPAFSIEVQHGGI
jgi:hypothetical protein